MMVTPSAKAFLMITCLVIPVLAVRTASRIHRQGRIPTRSQHLASVFVSQGMMLFLASSAARYDEIPLFPPPSFGAMNVVAAFAFLAPTLGTLPMRWRWKSGAEKSRMMWMLPHGAQDLWWWALVALIAGIVEEIVYRGVMVTLWQRILGSWVAAVAVCVAVFSISHFVQGWRAMVMIAAIAAAAHLIVRATGDLYTAMLVHFIYDFFAGMILLRLARRDGVPSRAA